MSADQDWKGLYRAGGASFLIIGVLTVIGIILLLPLGGVPASGQAAFTTLSTQKLLFQTIVTVVATRHLLLIPGVFALYVALKRVRKTYALIASGLVGLNVVVVFAANTVNFLSLIPLGDKYAVATTEAQRAAYVAAADLTVGAISVGIPLEGLVLTVGILIFGLAMLKGVFNKPTAYLGVLIGITGIIGAIPIPALMVAFIVALILEAVWAFAVGFKLYRLV